MEHYRINKCHKPPALAADWNDPIWNLAATGSIEHFRPESSNHHPETFFRVLYDSEGLYGIYLARDRFVRCIRPNYFDDVWKDNCVEFFVQPTPSSGYINFEFNCGGAYLCNYITDWIPVPVGFGWKQYRRIPPEIGKRVKVKSSLPPIVDPEIKERTDWTLQFFIPFSVIEEYTGSLQTAFEQQTWRGNFYKCTAEGSHPHWASYFPVKEFNFHLPRYFGPLIFEAP
jgi:hypothetical protein